jgi:hypothetical protein
MELRPESRGFLDRTQTDEYDAGPQLLKLFFFPAQLRHLLTAERSPVMAEKNQHQWPFVPEPAETGDGVVPQHHLLVFDAIHIDRHGDFPSHLIV